MARVLGVDHGDRRTGVAVSDPLGLTARPLSEVVADTPEAMVARVAALARQHAVERVVVGHPRNMDGTVGRRARSVEAFAAALGRALDPVRVELVDERLTSWEATRELRKKKGRGGVRRTDVNLLAARILLQSYLDSCNSLE